MERRRNVKEEHQEAISHRLQDVWSQECCVKLLLLCVYVCMYVCLCVCVFMTRQAEKTDTHEATTAAGE